MQVAHRPPASTPASGAGGCVARGALARAGGGPRLSHGSGRRSPGTLLSLCKSAARGFVRLQQRAVS